jgi:hypothetical protein
MPQDRSAQLADAERAELEVLAEALARWPRLSALLRYMGEKYFSGNAEQLNEYNIATEVLGRSKTVFNAAEDAIARVETHRLRKRLAEFYEAEGRDHPIQVNLPAGSYVPAFVHRPPASAAPAAEELSAKRAPAGRPSLWRWRYWALAASMVLAASGAYLYLRGGTSPAPAKPGSKAMTPESAPPGLDASALPLRLLAGYSGPPRTDSAGAVWQPDRYFSSGGTWRRAPGFIDRTSDSFLFDHSRTGDFSYSIPLKPGSYELHLYFSTPVRASESTSFSVWLNGDPVLPNFDINVDALGENVADECVFRDVSPGKDGLLRLGFSSVTGPPTLNALEILPGLPRKQLPIRLIMQTTPVTDHQGRVWHPDEYYMGGRLSNQPRPLLDSPDPDLFSGERYGHFTYAIPVDRRGSYTLILHFAELYFGPGASGNGGVGSRVFKVICNGETLLNNFDILKEAGSLHEIVKTFHQLKPSAQGKLNLTFEPISNNATVSGIEVLDESR